MTGRGMDPEKAKRIDIELRRRDLQESIDNSLTRIGHGRTLFLAKDEPPGETFVPKHVRFLPNKTWAKIFLYYLGREVLRHKEDIQKIERDIDDLCAEWGLGRPRVKDLRWITTKRKG